MRKYLFVISLMAIFLLAACGNTSTNDGSQSDMPTMVEVEILLPEKIEPKEEVKIEALVTQGEEKVEDATEVMFEVWKQGEEADHEMIEGNNDGSGIYSISKTFEDEGFYYVVAHTTARDMHVMPRMEVTVGNPDSSDREEAESEHNHHHDHDSHGDDDHKDHHGHEHESTLVMTLTHDENAKADQEVTLTTEIKQKNEALSDADVRFEVWHEDTEKHEYIVANEVSPGVYEAKTTFKKAGMHFVQIHVENNELHEHQLEEIEVE